MNPDSDLESLSGSITIGMNITFIAKPLFFKPGINGGVYPVRISSRTRGEEIAEYLGASFSVDGKYNEDDICIYLKPRSLKFVRDKDYVDILDDIKLIPLLKERSKIKVIAYNEPYYNFLRKELENEVLYIPHPHINFENKTRVKKKSIVGGMIGKSSVLSYPSFNAIKARLRDVGIEFKECFTYESRQEILDFYNQVDFHVVWYDDNLDDETRLYRHPGKIINAASFGAPTIAQKILGHQELEGDYIPAKTYEDVVREAVKLQNDEYYNELSKRLIEKAKNYHISEIARLYRQLQ